MGLPVLQVLKAEDAYAPRRATLGSQFQSLSHGPSDVGEANKMADNINYLFSIPPSIHYYINVSTAVYYINRHTYIYTTGSVTQSHTTKCQN